MKQEMQQKQAKDRLLQAALKLFAQQGYSGTTTRQIAAEAGSSLSMLDLHFGSKEGIYQAAVDRVIDVFLLQHFSVFQKILESRAEASTSRDAIWTLIQNLTDLLVNVVMDPDLRYEVLLLNRELQNENQSFQKIEPLLMFYYNYEYLFEAYAEAPANSVWTKQLSIAAVSGVLSCVSYPQVFAWFLLDRSSEDQKRFIKEYTLNAIRETLKQHI